MAVLHLLLLLSIWIHQLWLQQQCQRTLSVITTYTNTHSAGHTDVSPLVSNNRHA